MQATIKVGGVYRTVLQTGFWVKVAGVWQQVKGGYVKVGGVYQKFHQLESLLGTITVGNSGGQYGYENRTGPYGSLDVTTLQNGYVVKACRWDHLVSGAIDFALNGNSVPNADATFAAITIAGLGTFNRSAAGYATGTGYSVWSWTNNNSGSPTGGSAALTVLPA